MYYSKMERSKTLDRVLLTLLLPTILAVGCLERREETSVDVRTPVGDGTLSVGIDHDRNSGKVSGGVEYRGDDGDRYKATKDRNGNVSISIYERN